MKRLLSFVLVIGLVFSLFCPLNMFAAGTEFMIYGTGSNFTKEAVTLNKGDKIGIQFAVTAGIKSIDIVLNTSSNDKSVTFRLYKWTDNQVATQEADPLKSYTCNEWQRRGTVLFDFGEEISAGEYLVTMTLDEGDNLILPWIKPGIRNVRGYVNDYYTPGTPQSIITAASPADDIFGNASEPTEVKTHTAPPESVIDEDSAIAKMNVDSTLWGCVDGLGRTITPYSEAGNKKDKKVGVFYWTWHLEQSNGNKPVNVNSIIEEYPEAKNDYNHKAWNVAQGGVGYFWNEPLWGFYVQSDDYVLRKHAELLADAGVDFVAFDCTNQDITWESAYMNLLKVWDAARKDGVKTPQVAFMLQFAGNEYTTSSLVQIYDNLYRKGLYQDLWFYLDGKPLVIAYENTLSDSVPKQMEIAEFFTFRHGDAAYMSEDCTNRSWGWLSCFPQARYKKPDGTVEQITVGVAQNADYTWCYDENGNKSGRNPCSAMNGPNNMGRSWTYDKNYKITYKYCGKDVVVDTSVQNSKLYGFNVQEQWDYAISLDPEIIFVTGWNEWIAGRNETWGGVKNGFPDQCNDENSRDMEPTKGDLKDHYYMQLCDNVRRFKGAGVPVSQTKAKTMNIANGKEQWNDGNIIAYNDYTNDTLARDNKGWGKNKYTCEATRNDFKTAKASFDDDNIYFYVETVNDITPRTDKNWMRLLIDTVSSEISDDGFEGFEFVINREGATDSEVTVEKFKDGWNFETVGKAKYNVSGNVMQISVPRSYLGLSGTKEVKFNFKWCDNNLEGGDIMTLYTDGDTAPSSRFTFMFSSVKTKRIKDKGCGGTISGGIILVVALACVALRKKENI